MKRFIYIALLLVIAQMWSCQDFDEQDISVSDSVGGSGIVEMTADGNMRVTLSLNTMDMSVSNVDSRAASVDEDCVASGWCLIFGEDATNRTDGTTSAVYTENSPLLLKKKLTMETDDTFTVTLPQYDGVAFLRVVANLTNREEDTLEDVKSWADEVGLTEDDQGIKHLAIPDYTDDYMSNTLGVATFGEYTYQSVGLDGIYDITYEIKATYDPDEENVTYSGINQNKPNPNTNTTPPIPMSSIGFVFGSGINEGTLKEIFETKIYMVRVCSKLDVTITDSEFTLSEVYMIDCAQESRLRSTVLATSFEEGDIVDSDFDVPFNLGGTISYEALTVEGGLKAPNTTSPIYFYPNSGTSPILDDNGDADTNVYPQYIVVKGRAGGYDTDGYYKIALSARYPMEYDYDNDGNLITNNDGTYAVLSYTPVTYDILRNTHFKVDLIGVDKPGYKTYEDAIDPSNPACNISYSITILSSDGRNEILVSNGTYYVELQQSRVYAKGYPASEGVEGSITYDIKSSGTDTQFPAAYVQGDYGVTITGCSATNGVGVTALNVKDLLTDTTITLDDDTRAYYEDLYYGSDATVSSDIIYVIEAGSGSTTVTVNFKAIESGRIRMRIGDMLKFIPLRYESGEVSFEGGTLKIGNEGDFSYGDESNIDFYNPTTYAAGSAIFAATGKVSANSSTTDTREVQAEFYTVEGDGGKVLLYFRQAIYKDSTSKSSGNTLNDSSTAATGSDYTVKDLNEDGDVDYEDVVLAMQAMIDAGYTAIYIDINYSDSMFFVKGKTENDSVFDLLADYIAAQIAAGKLDSDFTFSVDFTDIGNADESNVKDFPAGYFQGNIYIESVVLPSSLVYIDKSAFSGCTSLTSVVIASDTDCADNFDTIKENAFNGCTSLTSVIIYSGKSITVESGAFTNTPLSNVKVSTTSASSGTKYSWEAN